MKATIDCKIKVFDNVYAMNFTIYHIIKRCLVVKCLFSGLSSLTSQNEQVDFQLQILIFAYKII